MSEVNTVTSTPAKEGVKVQAMVLFLIGVIILIMSALEGGGEYDVLDSFRMAVVGCGLIVASKFSSASKERDWLRGEVERQRKTIESLTQQ